MKRRYHERAHLLFTDTDSLMYHIETQPGEDVYQDMVANAEWFELSNYEASNPYYKPEFQRNNAKVRLMKDEAAGFPISDFVGLRPKMYSYLVVKEKPDVTVEYIDKHRAKGIQRVVAAKFTHDEYKAQLNTPEENFVVNRRLGSHLHRIYGIEVW